METERAATTEVHERLADTREEAQRTIVAEAEETERLRAELERTREDAEKLLAGRAGRGRAAARGAAQQRGRPGGRGVLAADGRARQPRPRPRAGDDAHAAPRARGAAVGVGRDAAHDRAVEHRQRDARPTTSSRSRRAGRARPHAARAPQRRVEAARVGRRDRVPPRRRRSTGQPVGRPRARRRRWSSAPSPCDRGRRRSTRRRARSARRRVAPAPRPRVRPGIAVAGAVVGARSRWRRCRCCCRGRWRSTRWRGSSGAATTARLALDTTTGPSWKPFPVLFTVVFAPFGGVAPALWLIVARAGRRCWRCAGAFVLGDRLAGRWAGVAAALAIALSPWWLFNTALGNSEGLLAAAVLWAVIAHLAGRHRAALALATAAALMRPEAWPFLAAYGLWLWRDGPARGDRRRGDRAAAVVRAGRDRRGRRAGRLAHRPRRALAGQREARGHPRAGRAGRHARRSSPGRRWSRRSSARSCWTGSRAGSRSAAAAWVAIVAVMTVAGYAGNPRYLVAAAALARGARGGGCGAAGGTVRRGAAGRHGADRSRARRCATSGPSSAPARRAADAFDGVIAARRRPRRARRAARASAPASGRARSSPGSFDLPMRDMDLRPERPRSSSAPSGSTGRGWSRATSRVSRCSRPRRTGRSSAALRSTRRRSDP